MAEYQKARFSDGFYIKPLTTYDLFEFDGLLPYFPFETNIVDGKYGKAKKEIEKYNNKVKDETIADNIIYILNKCVKGFIFNPNYSELEKNIYMVLVNEIIQISCKIFNKKVSISQIQKQMYCSLVFEFKGKPSDYLHLEGNSFTSLDLLIFDYLILQEMQTFKKKIEAKQNAVNKFKK